MASTIYEERQANLVFRLYVSSRPSLISLSFICPFYFVSFSPSVSSFFYLPYSISICLLVSICFCLSVVSICVCIAVSMSCFGVAGILETGEAPYLRGAAKEIFRCFGDTRFPFCCLHQKKGHIVPHRDCCCSIRSHGNCKVIKGKQMSESILATFPHTSVYYTQ